MMRSSVPAIAAGCVWLISALLLLPGILVGLSYDYNFSDWLSLLPVPRESEEILPWFFRIVLFVALIGSTAFVGAYALRRLKRGA